MSLRDQRPPEKKPKQEPERKLGLKGYEKRQGETKIIKQPSADDGKDSGLPDSGSRREFLTGAVRDVTEMKGTYHLLPPRAMRALAIHFQRGGVKYKPRNWEKGIPLEVFLDSLIRHAFSILEHSHVEDHAAAVAWNALAFIETAQRIAEGLLPDELAGDFADYVVHLAKDDETKDALMVKFLQKDFNKEHAKD